MPNEVSGHVLPFTVPQNSIEVLQRLRESYRGTSARESLTEADQAVLMVVDIVLKQVKHAQRPA